MKKLIIFPILFFFTFSFGQKKGIQGFKDADRYDKELVSKVNLELKGVPMVDTFKFNTSLLSLQIDLVADQKFITDTLPKFILDFYKKYKFPSEGKTNFVRIHLKSGGVDCFSRRYEKGSKNFSCDVTVLLFCNKRPNDLALLQYRQNGKYLGKK